jgi:hypothetical protein
LLEYWFGPSRRVLSEEGGSARPCFDADMLTDRI